MSEYSSRMIRFSDADLKEFIAIWKEDFKEELTMDRALAEARKVFELCSLIATGPEKPKPPVLESSQRLPASPVGFSPRSSNLC